MVEPDNRRSDLLARGHKFATTAGFLGKASQQSFGHTGADTHHEEAVPGLAGGLHHRVDGLDFTIRDEEHVIALCAGQGQRRQNRLVHLRATQVCLQFLGPAARSGQCCRSAFPHSLAAVFHRIAEPAQAEAVGFSQFVEDAL